MACIKPIMIVNGDSRVINKLETSLTDDARVVIYDCHMFIVLGTGLHLKYRTRLQRLTKDKYKLLTTLRFYLLQTRQLNKGQSINYKREKKVL